MLALLLRRFHQPFYASRLKVLGLWGGLISAVACSETTEPPLPIITNVAVQAAGPLSRTLSIELDRPGPVSVVYGAGSGTQLQVASSQARTEHQVLLTRLRANNRYVFEVRTEADRDTNEFLTDSLPDDLTAIKFTATGVPSDPLTLLELVQIFDVPDTFSGVVIVDRDGEIVWYRRAQRGVTGTTRRSNGNFVFLDLDLGLLEVTPAGRVVRTLSQEPDDRRVHHDVVTAPNGAVLFLANDRQVVDDTLIAGEAIWEWVPETDAQRKLWSSFDHLSARSDRGPRYSTTDWLHANSLSISPRGNIIVSLHRLNQIISIAPDYGTLEWRLGGTNATIQVPDNDRFSGQHSAAEVGPGRILLFDNGLERSEPFSRALEWEMTGTSARIVWEFRPSPDNWSRAVSSVRRLASGNSFIGFGMSEGLGGSTGPIEVYEVTPIGDVVWHLVVQEGIQLMYRATPLSDIAGEMSIN